MIVGNSVELVGSTKMNIDGLSHEALSELCREQPEKMAEIIQSMQADIAEMKLERIVNKYLILFHDAKKVLRPWDNTFLDIAYLRDIWMNNIVCLSELRHHTAHFIDTTNKKGTTSQQDMRMKFILEKLSDVDIMTPHVRHALKKLGGAAADDNDDHNDPVESMRCMLLHQYQNVEIDSESREKYECEWKYL